MLGYVLPEKSELKLREYEIYTGYYCGVCKYIGEQYGQLPRMALSYDAAFLALLLAAAEDEPDRPSFEHCPVHPLRRRTIIRNRAVEYAGDLMLILAWHKLQDDARDEGKAYAKATALLLKGRYRRLQAKHSRLCEEIEEHLQGLARLEAERCDSLDRAAEDFARIMETIFREGVAFASEDKGHLHETFAKVGYHLGKWIYLMDAVDDIEENLESGAYNPLLYRFSYDEKAEAPAEFRKRIDESLRFNLFHYLAVISDAVGELELKKNAGIIENIIYLGLNRRTEEVLKRITPPRRRIFGGPVLAETRPGEGSTRPGEGPARPEEERTDQRNGKE